MSPAGDFLELWGWVGIGGSRVEGLYGSMSNFPDDFMKLFADLSPCCFDAVF